MISFLQGKVILKRDKFIILEVRGVGYKVFLSKQSLSKISEKTNVKIFTYLYRRENVLDLYGFLNYGELEFFEILVNISGIGPKAGLEISSIGTLEQVKKGIKNKDKKIIDQILNIGKKKSQKIILEISGKFREDFLKEKNKPLLDDKVLQGLMRLGFSRSQARQALDKVPEDIKDTEQRIKQALKFLTG